MYQSAGCVYITQNSLHTLHERLLLPSFLFLFRLFSSPRFIHCDAFYGVDHSVGSGQTETELMIRIRLRTLVCVRSAALLAHLECARA